jgi:hypothetical protein
MFVVGHLFGDRKTTTLETYRTAYRIGRDNVACKIANDDAKGSAFNADFQRRGAKACGSIILKRLNVDGLAARAGKDRPGSVLRKGPVFCDAYADNVIPESGNPQDRRTGPEFDAIM